VSGFLAPLPGDPGTARALADVLAGQGDSLRALAGTLRGLADPGRTTWESPAGTAFAGQAVGVASVVERVARRYAVSAVAVRTLATALQQGQAEVAWAQRVHHAAWPEFLAASEAKGVAEASGSPSAAVEVARWQATMVEAGERAQRAERVHAEALARFDAADRRCAAVLHGLVDDGLADTRPYDLLTGGSRVAGDAATAAGSLGWLPELAPLKGVAAAAGVVQVGSDLTVKVAYGDGSWRSIGFSVGAAATGQAAMVLKRGARLTNATAMAQAGTRAQRRALRLTTAGRLRAATVEQVRRGFRDPRPPPKPVVAPALPKAWGPRARWVADLGEQHARAKLDHLWLDDLRAVTRTPGTSRRLFVAGVSLEGARTGVDRVGGALETRAQERRARREDAVSLRHDPSRRPGGGGGSF